MPSTTTTNITLGTLFDLVGQATQPQPEAKGASVFDALLQKPPVVDRPRDESPSPSNSSNSESSSSSKAPEYDYQREPDSSASQQSDKDKVKSAARSAGATKKPQEQNEDSNDAAEHDMVHLANAQQIAAASGVKAPAELVHAAIASESEEGPTPTESSVAGTATGKGKPFQPTKNADQSAAAVEVASPSAAEAAQRRDQPQKGLAPKHGEVPLNETSGAEASAKEQMNAVGADGGNTANVADRENSTGETLTALTDQPLANEPSHHDELPEKSDALAGDATALAAQISSDQSLKLNEPKTPPVVAPLNSVSPIADSTPVKGSEGAANAITAAATRRARLPGEVLAPAASPAARRGHVDIDSARLLTRVARALSAAQSRDGEVRLRLSPPELGSLKVEIRVHEGAMVAHLEAETDVAKTAIVDNLPTLRERLAEQGVRIERFDVDLMQRHMGGSANQSDQRQANEQPGALRVALPSRRSADAPLVAAAPARAATTKPGGLNVIV